METTSVFRIKMLRLQEIISYYNELTLNFLEQTLSRQMMMTHRLCLSTQIRRKQSNPKNFRKLERTACWIYITLNFRWISFWCPLSCRILLIVLRAVLSPFDSSQFTICSDFRVSGWNSLPRGYMNNPVTLLGVCYSSCDCFFICIQALEWTMKKVERFAQRTQEQL